MVHLGQAPEVKIISESRIKWPCVISACPVVKTLKEARPPSCNFLRGKGGGRGVKCV